MTGIEIGALALVALIFLILIGLPIAISMLTVSFVGVMMIRNENVAMRMIGSVANDSIEEYLYAVVPLFVLMGLLVTLSGVGRDTFALFERLLRRITAGLGVATVMANAVFASITGISIASASVFSRIAVPEMVSHGYTKRFATGVVAGSSVLGMLLPPSLLMIVYAIQAEESVGRMFLSGIGPGILLSVMFAIMIIGMAVLKRDLVFEPNAKTALSDDDVAAQNEMPLAQLLLRGVPIVVLILVVLGGIYGGFLNPTEAGAAGAFGALVIAMLRRSLNGRKLWSLLVETGQITVSVLFLIIAATFFSRMLAMSGLPTWLAHQMLGNFMGPYGFLFLFLLLVILLGLFIDSISIMLILLPIALPVAREAGFDLIWFGVLTVVAVEIGLLTPPFGLSVFTIKMALADRGLPVGDIFRGAFPFVLCMVACLIILVFFPSISTWFARL